MLSIPDLQRALRDESFAPPSSRTVSRRTALASLVAVLLATALLGADDSEAGKKSRKRRKKRRKRKKDKQPEFNAFGCLNVGQACNGDSNTCCSGICAGTKPEKGKKDNSRCVGHDAGTCQPGFDLCLGVPFQCSTTGTCVTTTGNAPFCSVGTGVCTPCQRDINCVVAGFGARAACVVCDSECPETGGTVCFRAR